MIVTDSLNDFDRINRIFPPPATAVTQIPIFGDLRSIALKMYIKRLVAAKQLILTAILDGIYP
jgi:hypothetical protein